MLFFFLIYLIWFILHREQSYLECLMYRYIQRKKQYVTILILGIFLFTSTDVFADCKIYKGDYTSYSNLLGTIKGDKIYKGDYTSYSNLLGTRKNNKVYKGDYASYSNLLATIKNEKVYKGDYASYSNLLGTIKKDKIYKGDYASYSNLVATGKNCSTLDLAFAAGVFLQR